MKDKEKQTKVFDILDKMEFFQGQRAGRELWLDKPKEVQDKDITDFIKDINYIRSYLQDSVVLSREEYIDLSRNYVGEQIAQAREQAIKDFAESICRELWNVGVGDNGKQFKYGDLTSKDVWRIAKRQLGAETKE